MKEMVGGCCVCSDDRGWAENPLVYCDGPGCTVAVHQACYGIVTVPTGNWYCRKCEVKEKNVKVRCELCPNKDGALKPTDNNAWAHVVCALYIPEVRFGNVTTMEPIILAQIPQERYNKTCYICEESNRGVGRSSVGACMQCNKAGCKQQFHVTCAQGHGLLCEEAGHYMDNVKYCGYCHHHYTKLKKGGNVKVIPPYRPIGTDSPESSPAKETEPTKATSKRKLSTGSTSTKGNKTNTTNSQDEPMVMEDEVVPPLPPPAPQKDSIQLPPIPPSAIQELKMHSSGKRKKGGSRTPPTTTTTGLSPDGSPRPITPQNNSLTLSNAAGTSQVSMNPVVSLGPLSGINIPLSTSLSGSTSTTLPPTTPSAGGLPGQVSAAAIVASTPSSGTSTSGNPTPVVVEPKRPVLSGVLKEARPNSIVVNVPLEVAMPSTTPISGNPVPSSSPSLLTVTDPISPPIPLSSQLEVVSQQQQLSSSSQQPPPVKRVRSQSSDKSENKSLPRRASKRGSSSTSTPSNGSSIVMGGNNKSASPTANALQTSIKTESNQPQIHHSGSHLVHGQSVQQQNHLPPLPSVAGSSSHMVNHVSGNDSSGKTRKSASHGGTHMSNHMSSLPNPIKEEKDVKMLTSNAPHMLGNQLNPTSTMAQKMCDTLSQEMVAHSVFNSSDVTSSPHVLVGPQPPRSSNTPSGGLAATNTGATTNNHGGNAWTNTTMPQTLEQLLERQWEQGSQFLMEQAQHFDIASLLSCLHQLRAENAQLEEHVNTLVQRRDHLLAVNARLAIPLITPVTSAANAPGNIGTNAANTGHSNPQPPQPAIVENGLPSSSPHPQEFRSNLGRVQGNGQNPVNSNPQFQCGAQNSVLVRTTAVEPTRRSSQSPAGAVYPNSSIFQQNPSPQLQSQVVLRRGDVLADMGPQQQSQVQQQSHHSQPNQQQPTPGARQQSNNPSS